MNDGTEQVIWNGRPSQVENLVAFVLCGLVCLTIFGAVVAVPYAIWRYLVTRCKDYKLTSQRLVIASGVLNKKNEQIELFRVKDIAWEEPLFLRLFALGRLTLITTDVSDPEESLNAIEGGMQLVETFRSAVTNLRQKNRVGDIETM